MQISQLKPSFTRILVRYIHIRILLHRPTFLRFCHKLGSESSVKFSSPRSTSSAASFHGKQNLRSTFSMQCSVACVHAAIQLTVLLHESVTTGFDGAWWYTIYCKSYILARVSAALANTIVDMCTAGLVLTLAESCLPMHEYFDSTEVHRAWLLGCETLRLLEGRGNPAEHALKGLCAMHQRLVPSNTSKSTVHFFSCFY